MENIFQQNTRNSLYSVRDKMCGNNHRLEVLHTDFRREIKRILLEVMRICEQKVTISNAILKTVNKNPILTLWRRNFLLNFSTLYI
jgi:hypothetical protein